MCLKLSSCHPLVNLIDFISSQEDTKIKEAQQEIASKGRAELQNLIKEYYELDEEDNIDGIKCRFKYVKVCV